MTPLEFPAQIGGRGLALHRSGVEPEVQPAAGPQVDLGDLGVEAVQKLLIGAKSTKKRRKAMAKIAILKVDAINMVIGYGAP